MPELPEVETVARQLASCLQGQQVRRAWRYDPKLRNGVLPPLAGRSVVRVARSGKRVLIEFSPRPRGGPLWLAVHLRMTGRLIWTDEPRPRMPPHVRARVRFTDGNLLFVDPRRFGTWSWYRRAADAAPTGLEPLSRTLTAAHLSRLIAGSTQAIKLWLLRQDRLVGLGNIYASEILHAAAISPLRRARSLSPQELRRLVRAIRGILQRAIRCCGTTFSDFQDARGREGSYQRLLAVYDREGRPCRRCRSPIARLIQGQRSTFHCPGCQR